MSMSMSMSVMLKKKLSEFHSLWHCFQMDELRNVIFDIGGN